MGNEQNQDFQITLLRHGQSAGNEQGLFQGQGEYPLTDLGRSQAYRLAAYWHLHGITFDAILSSPLKRALETAEIIAGVLRIPVTTDPAWMEQDFGSLSNQSVDAHYSPNQVENITPYHRMGEYGESRWQVYIRAAGAVQGLMEQPPARYLVASHGVLINLAISAMFGMSPMADAQGARFPHGNTGFSTLTYRPAAHRWTLHGLNQSPHLDSPALFTQHIPDYQFTFLRHAQSEGNANGLWQGQSDFPLSSIGKEEACLLAARWLEEGKKFDAIIASPLGRARQTAEIIANALGLPVEFDPIWTELHNGQYAGLTPKEAVAKVPPPEYQDLYHPIGHDCESHYDLYLRSGQALNTLLKRPGGNYLVVSHGGTLMLLFYHILGTPLHAAFKGPRIRFRNCAFATVDYLRRGQRWRILGVNDRQHAAHLEEVD